jgi:hypothetical protein
MEGKGNRRCCCNQFGEPSFKAKMQYKYWGYPEEFDERPFGTYVRAAMDAHIQNGIAAQLALYRFDFQDVTTAYPGTLTPRGELQLRKIAQKLAFFPFPVLIESTGYADIDAARRLYVYESLVGLSVVISEDQVVTGVPSVSGINGVEAYLIDANLLNQTQSRGAVGLGGAETSNTGIGAVIGGQNATAP